MKFFHIYCALCPECIIDPDGLIAYQVRRLSEGDGWTRIIVDLDGRQPWSGVRCVCLSCVKFLTSTQKTE